LPSPAIKPWIIHHPDQSLGTVETITNTYCIFNRIKYKYSWTTISFTLAPKISAGKWLVYVTLKYTQTMHGSHYKRQLSTHHYLCRMTAYVSFLNSFKQCGLLLSTCCFK
jgi:hypothetical protein